MSDPLGGKRILLGVTGSIAAYKALKITTMLRERGAQVDVLMSAGAKAFITPLSFEALSGKGVYAEVMTTDDGEEHHVALAEAADLLLIAPASADVIAKLAHGIADDPVTLTALCFTGTKWIAPAMHPRMWEQKVVQENVSKLETLGYRIIPPVSGRLASGETGIGRLPEPEDLLTAISADR